jgi:hypothetical protein
MISRHISIDEEYINKIKPYIDNHNNNLDAALNDIIYQVDMQDSHTNINIPLFDWAIKEVGDRLVPDDIVDKIIGPSIINSIEEFGKYINNRFNQLKWNIDIDLEWKYDNEIICPNMTIRNITIRIRGDPHRIKFVTGILSQYLIRHSSEISEISSLGIESVTSLNEYIRVKLSRMDKKQSIESLYTFFGSMDKILEIIKSKPSFWKTIIEEHILSSYKMVTIHKNCFEDILSNNMHTGDIMIEILTKKALQEIPLKELLSSIKNIYETSRIVDKIEIDNDDIIFYHNYRNQQTIDKLKKMLIALLENGGHSYDATSTSTMIILRHIHKNNFDQELTQFVIFLNGLKQYESKQFKIGD